ncbi:hypothetical protein CRG98_027522 [Punica granatum]|uniref:Treslin N-terminal domain-containing protein n=1 Tax=Punica granatum TaxID=22663 RepID=A0A2I0J8T7_PUNGR|nr:hypothetical protein CRG98_027522 [Punica granatum]
MATDPITDFSRTKRVVFLIDLDPLLRLQNADQYLTSVVSSAKTILSFPPLSSSLFSFKLFFSSLSPILSSSKLPASSLHLSFNDPCTTLLSLSQCLSSLPEFSQSSTTISSPRALNIAASLRQVLHDYTWDPVIVEDSLLGTSSPCNSAIRSNLVVLFSPIGRTRDWASQLIGVETEDEILSSVDQFGSKFCGVFKNVNSSFVSKDIHCSWVDVKYAPKCAEPEGLELVVNGIRSLGWGFCSTQSIFFGPMLVPFGLIYPSIGLPSKFSGFCGAQARVRSSLGLEITDVDGKPLECKLCGLQLVSLKNSVTLKNNDLFLCVESGNSHVGPHVGSGAWLEQFMGGTVKVEAVEKHGKFAEIKESSSEMILVQECSGKSEKDQEDDGGSEFFVDGMLQLLASEMGEFVRKSPPIWQIFLGFMYKEGYWALVSLTKPDGDRCFGVLKPFSIFSALISLTNEKPNLDDMVKNIRVGSRLQFIQKVGNQISGSKNAVLVEKNGSTNLKVEPSANKKNDRLVSTKSKKSHRTLGLFQDLTWSEFQKVELEGLDVRIDELYFARERRNSKKLKFLKCWAKQVKSYTCSGTSITDGPKPQTKTPKEMGNAAGEAHQASEQPISASDSLTAASRVQGEIAIDCGVENPEDVLRDIPNKIWKGLESKEVDLGILAQRLVNSSIYCLYQKPEMRDTSEEISAAIKDSVKQKFIKQICSLLEYIQSHLEGFFSDWSLHNYVEKIIKSRYSGDLEEVVHQIYSKMDLLLFDQEDDEVPNSLLNSEEESGQSWRDITEKGNGEVGRNGGLISAESESQPRPRKRFTWRNEERDERLIKARERRERARRVASYTSWVPDLQRVWAPKQQLNATKAKPEPSTKQSKRMGKGSVARDIVCETPLTVNKRPCLQRNESPDQDSVVHRSGPIPKALFPVD